MSAELLCRVTVPGEPIPKGRPRVTRHGARTPKRTVEAEGRIGWHVKTAVAGLGLPQPGRFRVSLHFRTTHPLGNGRGPDGDNCEKLILDALNGVVWLDDEHVTGCTWQMERGADRAETLIEIYRETN